MTHTYPLTDEFIEKAKQFRFKRDNPYITFNIDLSLARDNMLIPISGDIIKVLSATDNTANLDLRLNGTDAPVIPMLRYRKVKTFFDSIYITNDAQAGLTLDLILGVKQYFDIEDFFFRPPPDFTPYVPYVGATQGVNLGLQTLITTGRITGGELYIDDMILNNAQFYRSGGGQIFMSTTSLKTMTSLTANTLLMSSGQITDTSRQISFVGDNIVTTGRGTFGDLLVNTNTLFVDKVNSRVGIGTLAPGYTLHVVGVTRSSAYRTSSNDYFGFGLIETLKMRSTSGDDRGKLEHIFATGSLLSRNIADANPTFKIQNLHAGSTGDILQLQNSGGTVLLVTQGGKVGIGTIPALSAQLDISSTTGALLISRMTTVQKNALTAINGMIVYDTTLNAFYFYENGAWVTK